MRLGIAVGDCLQRRFPPLLRRPCRGCLEPGLTVALRSPNRRALQGGFPAAFRSLGGGSFEGGLPRSFLAPGRRRFPRRLAPLALGLVRLGHRSLPAGSASLVPPPL